MVSIINFNLFLNHNKSVYYKMKIKILLVFLASFLLSYSQYDENVKAILKEVSKNKDSYKTFKAKFELIYNNRQIKQNETNKGEAIFEGNKYKLSYLKSISIFDGKVLATVLPEEKEITITDAKKNDEHLINIYKLFDAFNKGHKYMYQGEMIEDKVQLYVIQLFPLDIKKEYKMITLKVNKENYMIYSIKYEKKNGIDITIKINSIEKIKIKNVAFFSYQNPEYSSYDIVDLREKKKE